MVTFCYNHQAMSAIRMLLLRLLVFIGLSAILLFCKKEDDESTIGEMRLTRYKDTKFTTNGSQETYFSQFMNASFNGARAGIVTYGDSVLEGRTFGGANYSYGKGVGNYVTTGFTSAVDGGKLWRCTGEQISAFQAEAPNAFIRRPA